MVRSLFGLLRVCVVSLAAVFGMSRNVPLRDIQKKNPARETRVCAAEQGMVFRVLRLKQSIQFTIQRLEKGVFWTGSL